MRRARRRPLRLGARSRRSRGQCPSENPILTETETTAPLAREARASRARVEGDGAKRPLGGSAKRVRESGRKRLRALAARELAAAAPDYAPAPNRCFR